MKPKHIRSAYNYDMNEASRKSGLRCEDPTLTDQSFAEEVRINNIVERYGLTGTLPIVVHQPKYGDYSGVFDFQTAMNAVRTAQEGFMELPARMRARFHNDPQELLAFLSDPENRPEAEKLGLVNKAKPQEPAAAPQSSPPEPPKKDTQTTEKQ